ncbi:MAG TPA: FG-GAP-like repeat-containing protein, partial [Cyclobacteriaceae bacterium]|nr:FG-GAP-like repeat-containing protein [Cyclobacteriaceae bacterium]
MRGLFLLIASITVSVLAIAQPRIDNVERISGYPLTTVQITGVGFSANAADLQVWFGSVKGTIVPPSTESLITVTVPASARLSFVEVINTATKRSAKSNKKFMPVFSGVQPFTNNFTVTSSTNADDIFDLCSCDFDGDGKPDIAGSKFKDGKSNIMMLRNTSTVAANNTTLSFAQTSITLAFPTFSVSCGDINSDGKPDLVASRGGTATGNSIFVFQNTSAAAGSITFSAPVQLDITLGAFAKQIGIRDLNRDGRPELIVTNGQSNVIYIFENKLTTNTIVAGEFTRVDKVVTGAVNADGTLALETADMTGDGWPEIIVSPNANATKIFILTNPADGTVAFTTVGSIAIGGGQNINDIAVADFDKDGTSDFVIADRSAAGGKA